MQVPINSVADLGLALRALRRTSKVRLDDMAAISGVSKQFASDVELGKETVQMGLVFKLLDVMGLRLSVDIVEHAEPELVILGSTAAEVKAPSKNHSQTSSRAGSNHLRQALSYTH